MVLLLQQRGAARQSPGHRAAEQPAADSSRRAAVPGQSQRRVPGLHLDGPALHGSHHGRSAHRRPELDLFPERRQLQRPDRLLHPGDLEQDRQAVQLPVHLRARPRRAPRRSWAAAPWRSTPCPASTAKDAQGHALFQDPQAAVPGGRRWPGHPRAGRDLLLEGRPATTPSRPGATAVRPAPGDSTRKAPGNPS